MKDWDKVYKNWDKKPLPNPLVEKYHSLAKVGRALDIACGAGGNALFLADKGFVVECFDKSKEAIKLVPKHPLIFSQVKDVKDFLFGEYELIVCMNFLERTIFKKIISSLSLGGIVILEVFNSKINPKFRVEKGELYEYFHTLEIIYYEEGEVKSRFVGRKV